MKVIKKSELTWLAFLVALSVAIVVLGRVLRQRQLNIELYLAAYDRGSGPKVDKMRELLAKGANPNSRFPGDDSTGGPTYQTPLHVAVSDMIWGLHDGSGGRDERNLQGVRLLVEHGADVNVRDLRGNTPLMAAARFNMPRVVHYLLQNGARADLHNFDGKTALSWTKANVNSCTAATAAPFVQNACDVEQQILREFRQAGVTR